MARLPRLMGRGRALEILLSGNDINSDIAERYGYVNRAPPDKDIGAEWERFIASVQRPAAQRNIKKLLELGLQKKADVEIHLDRYTGQVNQPDGK
ncbi:hypothetical protein D9M69_730830 [compost metagenome]